MDSKILTNKEIRQFAHQIQLPEITLSGQEKLKSSKIAIIGAGGMGASVLQYLAAIGVGKLGIIDFEMIKEGDVQRQTIYGENDLGKLKTVTVKQHLLKIFPSSDIDIINIQLTEENSGQILKPFHLIVDASNFEPTNQIVEKACLTLNLNYIIGSLAGFKGVASTFLYNKPWRVQQLLDLKNLFFQNDLNQKIIGRIALTYSFIGNILAMEVLKIYIDPSRTLTGKILKLDCLTYELGIQQL